MSNFFQFWLRILVLAILNAGAVGALAAEEFLDPEAAFKLTARAADDRTVELSFTVAPGYYLYREPFRFVASEATLGPANFPPGKVKFDETFQKDVETHRGVVRISIPVQQAPSRFLLMVSNQGCADKGLCYPPMQRSVEVSLAGFGGSGEARVLDVTQTTTPAIATPTGGDSTPVVADVKGSAAAAGSGLDAALRGGVRILRCWRAAVAHSMRAADVADTFLDHRRTGRGGLSHAWPRLGGELLVGYGNGLHGARCRRWPGR